MPSTTAMTQLADELGLRRSPVRGVLSATPPCSLGVLATRTCVDDLTLGPCNLDPQCDFGVM